VRKLLILGLVAISISLTSVTVFTDVFGANPTISLTNLKPHPSAINLSDSSNADIDVVLSEVYSFQSIFYYSIIGIVGLTIFLNYAFSKKIKLIQKEKDDYVGMITHDLKQAFLPINIAITMLKDPEIGTLSTQQLERVRDIEELSAKQLAMINNMLAAQKIGAKALSYDIEKLDAKDVIQKAIKINKPLMSSKDIKLFTLLDEDIQISADRNFILEVFTNLILNSYDFVSHKGLIEVGATKKDGFATFFVKDNGKGIPKNKLSSIFKPYGSIVSDMKRELGGTGLGLSVSKELVQGMGGKIWVESTVNKETTFYFLIPLSK
jgi:signal transduction histidine kinase